MEQEKGISQKLTSVWSHSSFSTARKFAFSNACIVPQLINGLFPFCLQWAEKRSLDNLPARSLRKILYVQHAYYSRISSWTVLERAGHLSLSHRLLQEQMKYMRRLAQRISEDPVRSSIFLPRGIDLRTQQRGRPCTVCARGLYNECSRLAGSSENLEVHFRRGQESEQAWAAAVKRFRFSSHVGSSSILYIPCYSMLVHRLVKGTLMRSGARAACRAQSPPSSELAQRFSIKHQKGL